MGRIVVAAWDCAMESLAGAAYGGRVDGLVDEALERG
jgi:hypothetical protein